MKTLLEKYLPVMAPDGGTGSDGSGGSGGTPAAGAGEAGGGNQPSGDPVLDAALGAGEPGDNGDAGGEDDLDDLEFAFGKYRVPKKLAEAVKGLQTTFTQKTQEFSTEKAALEARAQARADEQAKLSKEELQHRVALHQIDSQLEQYGKLTAAQWNEMKETNYEAWNEHRLNVISLQNARAEAEGKVTAAEAARSTEAQTEMSKRLAETAAYAATIPGYTPDLDAKIVNFALEHGFSKEEIKRSMSPATYKVLHLARIGEELLKRQAAARTKSEPVTEPLEMVGAKKSTPPTGLDDRLSTDEWMRRRNRQVAGTRR
jgi:hypothetical protein